MQVCVEQKKFQNKRFKVFDQNGTCKYYAVADKLRPNHKFHLYKADNDEQILCINQALLNYGCRFKIIDNNSSSVSKVKMRGGFGKYQKLVCKNIYGNISINRRKDSDRYKIYREDKLIGAILKKRLGEIKYLLDVKDDVDIEIGISLVIMFMLRDDLVQYRKIFNV